MPGSLPRPAGPTVDQRLCRASQQHGFSGGAFVHGTGVGLDTTSARGHTLRIRNNQWSLLVDSAATSLGGAMVDYTPALPVLDPCEIPNFLFFGDDTTSASAAIALKAVTLGPVPLPASAWLLILGLPGLRQRPRRKPLHQGRPMA